MTLLWADSFEADRILRALQAKYTVSMWPSTFDYPEGRLGGLALPGNSVGFSLTTPSLSPTGTELILGIAIDAHSPDWRAGSHIQVLNSSGQEQLYLRFQDFTGTAPTGAWNIGLRVGNTWLLRSEEWFGGDNGGWFFIELKVDVRTVGSWELRVNNAVLAKDDGPVDCAASGLDGWDKIVLKPNKPRTTGHFYIDDLYILDGDGSDLNDFLGPVVVEMIHPVADGYSSEWALP